MKMSERTGEDLGETRASPAAPSRSIEIEVSEAPAADVLGATQASGAAAWRSIEIDVTAAAPARSSVAALDETRAAPARPPASSIEIEVSEGSWGAIQGPAPSRRRPAGDPLGRGHTVGRYLVLGRLGAGGMGVVHAAYDPELDRKVALKLLRPELSAPGTLAGDQARARLLREAQALARLAHPNVVAIHDVGAVGDAVWLAMEFVEGETLGAWLAARRPGWRELLEVMRAAGRGLQAAHAAGLVHRDFKPDNVMVARDGRVRVMDLGLARAREGAAEPASLAAAPGDRGVLGLELTRAGAVLGTPAYMAPEQFRGEEADAAADIFAFCLTFWEGLHGERPFAGETYGELEESVLRGALRPPSRPRAAPRWLRRVLARGLAVDRAQRWPSMQALLDALARGQARARLGRVGAGALVVALSVASAFAWREAGRAQARARCEAAGASIDEIWGEEARARARAGVLATGLSYAEVTADKVTPWLDRQRDAWQATRTEVCVDAELRGLVDDDARARGEWCLEERRAALASLAQALAEANAGTVKRAVGAAAALDPVAACRDPLFLARLQVPPAEVRAEVLAIRDRFARALDLEADAKADESVAAAREVLGEAEALAWPPLVAGARLHLARALGKKDDLAGAEAAATDAYFEAVASGALGVAADAATTLVNVVGGGRARHDEGALWARHAAAAIELVEPRAGVRTARRLQALGGLLTARGAYPDAVGPLERALEIRVGLFGETHPEVAESVGLLASLRERMGERSAAAELHARALAITEETLGARHPDVAARLVGLGQLRVALGEVDAALPLIERATAIYTDALGPAHTNVGKALFVLAGARQNQGDVRGALAAHERALAIFEEALGPEHPTVAIAIASIANDRVALGEYEEAKAQGQRAVAIFERALGPDHPDLAKALKNLALVHKHLKELDEARRIFVRVLAIREKALGPRHEEVALSLFNLGRLDLERGDLAAARAPLERALDIAERTSPPAQSVIAEAAVSLAELALGQRRRADALALAERALAASDAAGTISPMSRAYVVFKAGKIRWEVDRRGRAGARARIAEARAALAATGGYADTVEEIDAWLAAHPHGR